MAGRGSSQITLRVVLGVFFSTIACVVIYSFFLPLTLDFDAKERSAFLTRMLAVGTLVDLLCTIIVFRMYRPIAGALRGAGGASRGAACAAFERIPGFLLWFGACAYVFAALINVALGIAGREAIDVGLTIARLALAAAWGFLNGIVTARLLNIIMIDAKIALGIYDIEGVEGGRKLKRKTLRGRLLIAGLSIFLFLLAYCGVIFYVRIRGMYDLAAAGSDAAAIASYGSRSMAQGIGIMLGLLALAVGLYFIVLAEMQAHFDNLLGQVGRIARGDHDLARRVNVVSFDDIGRMTSGFNRILDSFSNTFRGVRAMADAVSGSSSSIRDASEGAKRTATSLARLAEEAGASERGRVAELEAAVRSFKEAAEGIGGSAARTADGARGIEAASEGIRSMVESLAASGDEADRAEAAFASLSQAADMGVAGVRKSLEAARAIDEAGSRVSGIARIIADVADRSNLLAMNASIEAAHGGQAGKGFGVVAREMKTLAESVGKSAREIDEQVRAVADTNRRTVQAIEGLGSVFSALSAGIGESGAALRDIASSARRNAEEAKGDLELIERLRSFLGEIVESSRAARASVEAMEKAVDGLSGSQEKSHEVNVSLTEGVRSIAGAFDELDASLASALEGVSALEEKVASYKLD